MTESPIETAIESREGLAFDDSTERHFVEQLRAEAQQVKECFTQFSFQAIGVSAVALGLIFAAREVFPMADYAAIPVIGLLMAVARIGIYKYSTYNRQAGYELHLARTRGSDHGDGNWRPHMRGIRWEEAVRAWRVVQPALFRTIYRTPENWPRGRYGARVRRWVSHLLPLRWLHDKLPLMYLPGHETRRVVDAYRAYRRRVAAGEAANPPAKYPWFMLLELTSIEGSDVARRLGDRPLYHAGTYLKNMLGVLLLMECLLIIPLALGLTEATRNPASGPSDLGRYIVLVLLLVFVLVGSFNVDRRREILENELLSIHANAVTWQAVVLAHYRALHAAAAGRRPDFRHYTQQLVAQALDLAHHAFAVHSWIDGTSARLSPSAVPQPVPPPPTG